jgi:hypothetical protein
MSITLSEMNAMDFDVFVETFGNVIEHSALVTAALWTKRPFSSLQNVVDQINAIVHTLPTDGELYFFARNVCLLQRLFVSIIQNYDRSSGKRTSVIITGRVPSVGRVSLMLLYHSILKLTICDCFSIDCKIRICHLIFILAQVMDILKMSCPNDNELQFQLFS